MKKIAMKALALSVCTICMLSFTACSKNSDGSASTPGEGSGDAVKITVWDVYGPGKGMDKAVEAFNSSHSDIAVTEEYITDQAEMMQKIQVAAASSGENMPDVALTDMINSPLINEIVELVDLSTYLETDEKLPAEDFYENLLQYGQVDGKQISIPGYVNNMILYYNKELFENAGLDPEQPPKTWDELVSYAQKLTTDKVIGYMPSCLIDTYYEATSWQYQIFVWQCGGEMWDRSQNFKPMFNSPEGIEAMQFLHDLIYKYKVSTVTPPENAFPTEQLAMIMEGTWMGGDYLAALEDKLGAAPLPYNKEPATNTGGEQWCIISSDQVKEDAAWEFISYMENDEEALSTIFSSGYVPARKSLAESDFVLSLAETSPAIRASLDSLPSSKMRIASPKYNAASEASAGYLQQVLYDKISVEEGVQLAAEEFESVLNGN